MAVIKDYIKFLREYNKLLERGSKNVFSQKDTLWEDDLTGASITKQISFDSLFSIQSEDSTSNLMLKVKRPIQPDDNIDENEETFEEKFERESYSFLYKAARDIKKNSSLEFVYSFGLFNIYLGEAAVKVHFFNIPLKATLSGGEVIFKLSETEDPYVDAYFLNHPDIDRANLETIIEDFEGGIDKAGIAFLKSKDFKNLITRDMMSLHPSLVYNSSHVKPSESSNTNFVAFAPIFILRKKRPRHFQKLMNKIIEFTSVNDPDLHILDILLRQRSNKITNETPYFSQLYSSHKDKVTNLDSSDFKSFFPLPFNDEQLAIYENYKSHDLSVVTGPPGTGKSHSIVNLLCGILAEGKRVLITAKTDKALESLLNKIPKEFNGLVMADIKQDHSSSYTLSNSIDSIRELLLDRSTYKIDSDLKSLDRAKENYTRQKLAMASVLKREHERIRVDHFNKEYDIYELFEFVSKRANEWDWIKDEITPDITIDSLKIIDKLKEVVKLKDVDKQECKLDLERVNKQLDEIDFELLHGLQNKRAEYIGLMQIDSMDDFPTNTVNLIRENLHHEKNDALKVLNKRELSEINSICKDQPVVLETTYVNITVKDLIENKDCYRRDISTYLALIPKDKIEVGFLQSLINPKLKKVKYLEEIAINDSFCDNRNDLITLRKFLDSFSILYKQVDILSRNHFIHNNLDERCSLGEMHKQVTHGLKGVQLNIDLLTFLNLQEVKTFTEFNNIELKNIKDILGKADELHMINLKLSSIDQEINKIKDAVVNVKNILNGFGIKELSEKNDILNIKNELKIIQNKHDVFVKFQSANLSLKEILPETLRYFINSDDSVKGEINNDSLHLKLASLKIEDITTLDIKSITQKLNHGYEIIQQTKAKILSGLSKDNFKNRFDENQKNEFVNLLTTFKTEFDNSKRGIKDQEKFRRKAQKTAQRIAPKIACWVMKYDDVLKTIDEKPHVFDCVIVDEASQLDFNSILLGYYTKKIIVVGDEKQTSPQAISIKDESFNSLRKKELSFMGDDAIHIRFDASLFSLSQMVAGTTNQMLKEHFRCVPDLIDFSNKHYYEGKIIPLKVLSANRLKPKIVRFVSGGTKRNNVVSKEVEVIKSELIKMLSMSEYESKSIGIVSLGSTMHTNSLKTILENISQKKLEKHNIIIDNPSEFQGDERDVIIVSLGEALSLEKDVLKKPTSIVDNISNNLTPKLRGINVGLSRAKEQMILVYSVTQDDLKENDFRRKIITFFNEKYNPVKAFILPPDLVVSQRMIENRPKPFDSWFEYDVAKALIDNGYNNLIPQYEVKSKELFNNPKTGETTYIHFKIDIVVYHNGTPVAIECDGDIYHSEIEDVAYDIERQEFLQRLGWKVHRITYSSFRIDPKKEVTSLIDFILRNTPEMSTLNSLEEAHENSEEENSEDFFVEPEKVMEEYKESIIPRTNSRRNKGENLNLFNELGLENNLTPSMGNDLFANSLESVNEIRSLDNVVKVNSTCIISFLDQDNKESKIILMDVARDQMTKTRDGIQIVSIYSDLGKLVLDMKDGQIAQFPKRNQRVKVVRIF